MNPRRNLLAIGCLLLMFASVRAQTAQSSARGFIPKHEQVQRDRQRRANSPFTRAIDVPEQTSSGVELPAGVGSHVQQANFEQFSGLSPTADTWGAPCSLSNACAATCYQPTFWVRADYLLWSTRKANAPALVSTSIPGTAREAAGVLDEAGVSTLFGGDGFHGDLRSGTRFSIGAWFSPQRLLGMEVNFSMLAEDELAFSGGEDQFAILARPFFNLQLFEEDSRLINFPEIVRGDLNVQSTSEFDTVDVLLVRPTSGSCGATHLLVGYRQASLDERIRFDETTTSLVSPTLDSRFELSDQFSTENTFRGGQIGFRHHQMIGHCWTLDWLAKASLGSTRSRIQIAGQTTTTTASGDVSSASEGLMALASNSGVRTDSEFGSLFELGVNLRRQWRNGWEFRVGYNYLHWSTVARAVEQIDRSISPTQVPPDTNTGPDRPRVPFARSGFWAQGLNLGLSYQF